MRHPCDRGQAEEIYDRAADCYFRSDVEEDSQYAEPNGRNRERTPASCNGSCGVWLSEPQGTSAKKTMSKPKAAAQIR